ncbi:MAG: hypothetical protein ABID61_05940 [Candidatus Micrarchaeota archaeon]
MATQLQVHPETLKAAKEAILATIPPDAVQHFDRFMRNVVIEQIKARGGTSSPDLVNAYMHKLLGDSAIVKAYFRNELEKPSVFQQIAQKAFTKDDDGYITLNSGALDREIGEWIKTTVPPGANTTDMRSILYSEYMGRFETSRPKLAMIPTKIEQKKDAYALLKEQGIIVNVTQTDVEDSDGYRNMVVRIQGTNDRSSILFLSEGGLKNNEPLSRRFEDQLTEHIRQKGYTGPDLDSRQIALVAAYCTEEFNWHARMMAEAQKHEEN